MLRDDSRKDEKQMRRMVTKLGFLVVLGTVLFSSGDLHANISAYAIGVASCVRGSTTGELTYPWKGVYNNSTTQEVSIDCSLPFTYNSASDGGNDTHVASVFINVDDRSTTLDIHCEMRLMDLGGDIVESGGGFSTTGTGEQPLSWFVNSFFTIPYVSCVIPRKVGSAISGVQGMQVDWRNLP
jgi:hypothetical protein